MLCHEGQAITMGGGGGGGWWILRNRVGRKMDATEANLDSEVLSWFFELMLE